MKEGEEQIVVRKSYNFLDVNGKRVYVGGGPTTRTTIDNLPNGILCYFLWSGLYLKLYTLQVLLLVCTRYESTVNESHLKLAEQISWI